MSLCFWNSFRQHVEVNIQFRSGTVLPSRKKIRKRSIELPCMPFDSKLFLPLKNMTVIVWLFHFCFRTRGSLNLFCLVSQWSDPYLYPNFYIFFMAFMQNHIRSCHPVLLLASWSSTNPVFSEQYPKPEQTNISAYYLLQTEEKSTDHSFKILGKYC